MPDSADEHPKSQTAAEQTHAWRLAAWSPSPGVSGLALKADQRRVLAGLIDGHKLDPEARRAKDLDAWHQLRRSVTRLRGAIKDDMPTELRFGLRFSGDCPRCRHWMISEVAVGAMVEPQRLAELFREPVAITFACCCGTAHEGRPDDAAFLGCGALWSQAISVTDAPARETLEPATATDAAWLAHSASLATAPLTRIRGAANQWRNGVTGLTAVLTAVALLRGPAGGAALHPLAKWLTFSFSVAGFVLLLAGTFSVLRASFGSTGYDQQFMSVEELRNYERRRGREALIGIERTRYFVLAGVASVALGVAVAYLNVG